MRTRTSSTSSGSAVDRGPDGVAGAARLVLEGVVDVAAERVADGGGRRAT